MLFGNDSSCLKPMLMNIKELPLRFEITFFMFSVIKDSCIKLQIIDRGKIIVIAIFCHLEEWNLQKFNSGFD